MVMNYFEEGKLKFNNSNNKNSSNTFSGPCKSLYNCSGELCIFLLCPGNYVCFMIFEAVLQSFLKHSPSQF